MAVHKLNIDEFDEIDYQLIAIHTGGTDEPKHCNIATPINDKIIYFIKRWCTENNISIDSR